MESEYANIEEFYAKYRPRSAFLSKANLSYLNMEMVRGKSGTYFGQREDRKKTGVGVYIGQEGYVYEGISRYIQASGNRIYDMERAASITPTVQSIRAILAGMSQKESENT